MTTIRLERQQSSSEEETTAKHDNEVPELPFVTTSDVLKQLNKQLEDSSSPGEILQPRFELQKRLPDGSTIPANESDLACSDLQTKLQQSATFVGRLQDSDKAIWAEDQRVAGNAYFQRGDYKVAMDIYLTCLVVKQQPPSFSFLQQTLVPVLNNLAQCTLQLGMHKKTMEFCKIAFEEIGNYENKNDNGDDVIAPIARCKLYFKRAKALRLTGSYLEARNDLHQSLTCLEGGSDSGGGHEEEQDDDAATTAPYRQAIQKEFRYVEAAEKEARKNRQRQRRAMQNVLSQPPTTTNDKSQTTSQTNTLYDKQEERAKGPRQYSTLRARKATPEPQSDEPPSLSYWQYYWAVVARVSETLLVWIGDEETKEKLKTRKE
jgi:tetratricopeptide (TPR) repeat protein